LKNLWCCTHFLPEESVVFHALLPEVLAVVSLIKVELNNILVVALQNNKQLNDDDKILVHTMYATKIRVLG
jgi:hypothetical protein